MIGRQIQLPFEKLVHALRNFPEAALQPDVLLPLAYNIKVPSLPYFCWWFKVEMSIVYTLHG